MVSVVTKPVFPMGKMFKLFFSNGYFNVLSRDNISKRLA